MNYGRRSILASVDISVQRRPRDVQHPANVTNGVRLVPVELLGDGHFG